MHYISRTRADFKELELYALGPNRTVDQIEMRHTIISDAQKIINSAPTRTI